MVNFKKYQLKEIASIIISNVDKKCKEGESEVRLCNFTDVYYNWAVTKNMNCNFMIATASDSQRNRFLIRKGQVAITKDSETRDDIGIPCLIADNFENTILGYHCALITPDSAKLDGGYLNVYLHSCMAKTYFANNATGSGMRYTLNSSTIEDFIIYLPSLSDQKRVGKLFADIERKIALNREINHNLQALAKQLYDYWFVQFDFPDENGNPYKSSGGEMVWNERLKREIPKRWGDAALKDFLTIRNGRDHKHLPDGVYPVYGSGGRIRYVSDYLYDGESILMPRKGSLNNVMYVDEAFWSVDTMFHSSMKTPHSAIFVFYSIKDIDFTKWDGGTGVPSMTSSTLYSIKLIKPCIDILKVFDDRVKAIYKSIKANQNEIEYLIKLRDELLPLLMNGQVSVNYDLSSY